MQILETCGPQPERCFRVCTLVNGPNTVSSRFYRACQEEYDINEEEEQRWKGEAEKQTQREKKKEGQAEQKMQREKEEQENLRKDGNQKVATSKEEKIPPLRPTCGSN